MLTKMLLWALQLLGFRVRWELHTWECSLIPCPLVAFGIGEKLKVIYVYVHLYEFLCTTCTYIPVEARRGHQTP